MPAGQRSHLGVTGVIAAGGAGCCGLGGGLLGHGRHDLLLELPDGPAGTQVAASVLLEHPSSEKVPGVVT